jgi:2-oxoisovalerate dehydrogenase E2 component (dihydrolipoyl transacylase)
MELKKIRHSINRMLQQQPHGDVTKISFMPLLIKSFSVVLQTYPLLNAQYIESDGSNAAHLLYRRDHNIGIAMDTPSGLLVPNVAKVNQKSVLDIANDLLVLQAQAKKGSLPPSAFQNTTITISNIGNIGGRVLGPVIPPDTVCIAAIGRSVVVPRLVDREGDVGMVKDEVMTVSFSADHRVVDGATVARFFRDWKSLLEDPGWWIASMK